MSWLYVPGLEASPLASSELGRRLAQSVMWREKPMRQQFWSNKWKKEHWLRHLSGVTLHPLMATAGVNMFISSLPASPANRSAWPENAWELAIRVGYGPKSSGYSMKPNPQSSLWRMSLRSGSTDLRKYSADLPFSGSMRSGVCSAQPRVEPPISANASSSWLATPTAKGNQLSPAMQKKWAGCRNWVPTPTASDYGRNKGGSNPEGPERPSLSTMARSGILPTVTSRDWKTGKASIDTLSRNSRPLSEYIGGLLDPAFTEALMGLPIGWTAFEPPETQ